MVSNKCTLQGSICCPEDKMVFETKVDPGIVGIFLVLNSEWYKDCVCVEPRMLKYANTNMTTYATSALGQITEDDDGANHDLAIFHM